MKILLHIDIDAFFPTIAKNNDPSLINKPISIGSNANRGVISSACYIGRKYGLKAGMPNFKAKKLCPECTFVSITRTQVNEYASLFRGYLSSRFDDMVVASIDECYVDATKWLKNKSNIISIINNLKDDIFKQTNLKVSIGVSNIKFLAKMATNLAKPNGVATIFSNEVENKLWNMPIEKFHGIGRTRWPLLKEVNIKTIGDLAKISLNNLEIKNILGSAFDAFIKLSNGIGKSVIYDNDPVSKSISNARTFLTENIVTEKECLLELKNIFAYIHNRLVNEGFLCKVVSLTIKYANFRSNSKQINLPKLTNNQDLLFNAVNNLFLKMWKKQPVRLLSISFNNLINKFDGVIQMSIFDKPFKETEVDRLIRKVNKKFKMNIIKTLDQLKK